MVHRRPKLSSALLTMCCPIPHGRVSVPHPLPVPALAEPGFAAEGPGSPGVELFVTSPNTVQAGAEPVISGVGGGGAPGSDEGAVSASALEDLCKQEAVCSSGYLFDGMRERGE
jgi:hypothetical protein